MIPKSEVGRIAASLTKAQRDFMLSLPEDGTEKHWPTGIPVSELSGLRGFGQRDLTAGRYGHSGTYQRLTPLGLAVREHLLQQDHHND